MESHSNFDFYSQEQFIGQPKHIISNVAFAVWNIAHTLSEFHEIFKMLGPVLQQKKKMQETL